MSNQDLNKIAQHISEVVAKADSVKDVLHQISGERGQINRSNQKDITDQVLIYYFDRVSSSFESIAILLIANQNRATNENAIGLILRSSISDILFSMYLATPDLPKDDSKFIYHENFWERLISLISDSINHTLKTLTKRVNDSNDDFSQNDLKEHFDGMLSAYPIVFKSPPHDLVKPWNNLIKSNVNIRLFELVRKIKQHSEFQNIDRLLDFYNFYSKYEHSGIMTLDFQSNQKENLIRAKEVIFYMCGCLTALTSYVFIVSNYDKRMVDYQKELKISIKKLASFINPKFI